MLSTIEYQNFTDTASSQLHKERPEESANPPLIIIRITFGLKRVQTAGQLVPVRFSAIYFIAKEVE